MFIATRLIPFFGVTEPRDGNDLCADEIFCLHAFDMRNNTNGELAFLIYSFICPLYGCYI